MIEAKKESSPDTATLRSNYEDLIAYVQGELPGVVYPPGRGKDIKAAEEGVKIAGSIPPSKFVGYRAKQGKQGKKK